MTIGKAIYKVTKELADWYLLDTGSLEVGKRADVTIIDPNQLGDELEETQLAGMPGLDSYKRLVRRNDDTISHVFVNGKLAWRNGSASAQLGQQKLGEVLRAQG